MSQAEKRQSGNEATSLPRISVAIPVFNGEGYLQQAINSVLSQTHNDFELIIVDNASTDSTEAICRNAEREDGRIRYFRNETNIGAAKNFNKSFHLSRGEFFKWLASDEAIEPCFLESALRELEADQGLIAVLSNFIAHHDIDGVLENQNFNYRLITNSAIDRVRFLLFSTPNTVLPIWGLYRRAVLEQSDLIGSYVGSDICLVVQLAIAGRIEQLQDNLLHLRTHSGAYHRISSSNDGVKGLAEAKWFDPEFGGRIVFPHWRMLRELGRIILTSEQPTLMKSRLLVFSFVRIPIHWRVMLLKELMYGLGLRRMYNSARNIYRKRSLESSIGSKHQ